MTRPSVPDSAAEAASPARAQAAPVQARTVGKLAIALALKLGAAVCLALLWVLLMAQPLG